MSDTAHTAGPWKWLNYPDGRKLLAASSRAVIHCPDAPMTCDPKDAALIAAAPDLLACLRRMCGMYSAYSRRLAPLLAEDEGTVWTFERANSLALEAIAKAEGR
jgi:hypothetical protein